MPSHALSDPSLEEVARDIALYDALADADAAGSVHAYLDRITIDSVPPARFGVVAEPWQWDVYSPLYPALEALAGIRKGYTGPRCFWFGLPKGHDKTSQIGRLLNWLLAYSRRPLNCYCAAKDTDQATLITQSMAAERRLNPWLASRLGKGQMVVRGPGGFLQVLTSDAGSNQGLKPDFVVCDEVTVWDRTRGVELWTALFSGMEKRPGSVFVVISNAGVRNTWQHDRFLEAQSDPDTWHFYAAQEGTQLASWMTPERVDKLRAQMLPSEGRRLFDNTWIDPGEESGYLNRADVERCEQMGREMGLVYRTTGEKNTRYWASIDYGPKRDRTALCVAHLNRDDVVIVDRLDVWQGSDEEEVQISKIRSWLADVDAGFGRPDLVLDPYQLLELAQDEKRRRLVEVFEARGGKRTFELCESFRSQVVNHKIAWYPGAGTVSVNGRNDTFADELVGLVLKEMGYGYRFDHTARFHDDRAVAVGMAALMCVNNPQPPWTAPTPIPNDPTNPLWERDLREQPTAGFMGMQSPGDLRRSPDGFLQRPTPRFLG